VKCSGITYDIYEFLKEKKQGMQDRTAPATHIVNHWNLGNDGEKNVSNQT
jgi:hypothetical protein